MARTRIIESERSWKGDCYTVHMQEGMFYRLSCLASRAYERTGWIRFDDIAYILLRISQVDSDAVFALAMLVSACIAVGFILGIYGVLGVDGILSIWEAFKGAVRGLYEATRAYVGL